MEILYFLTVLFVFAQAKHFEVKSGTNACLLLDIEGSVDFTAYNGSTQVETATQDLAKATQLESSACDCLKLDLGQSAELWFNFTTSGDRVQISLTSAFNATELLHQNEANTLVFTVPSADVSSKNESYLCEAGLQGSFGSATKAKLNYSVDAKTTAFKAQAFNIQNNTYSDQVSECDQDRTTTPSKPTTPSTVSPTTTPKPHAPVQNFTVSDGNITCIDLIGAFSFAIIYDLKGKTDKATAYVNMPEVSPSDVTGNCTLTQSTQSLEIKFFPDWKLEYIFEKDGKKGDSYHISNITLTFKYDSHFKNAKLAGETGEAVYSSDSYMKATSDGYYLCDSNTTLSMPGEKVKLTTKNLKYVAFNEKENVDFNGSITECEADEETSSVVPIAVGAALAGLVVIVIIAYLIGRQRSRKSGYESV